ncbi:MAG: hypothetical protein R3244_01375, partial [Thermoanaerobaculia bacterium]|nr:hypothetical protein [Thermoanaerobaculia bacterium]
MPLDPASLFGRLPAPAPAIAGLLIFGAVALPAAAAPPGRVLTDAEWIADLDQVTASIHEVHPDPFHQMDASDEASAERRAELAAAVVELRETIPRLSDREIVVRLSQLVARLDDGHSRLFLPHQHRDLAPALEAGHSGTEPPAHEELALAQLPTRFGLFSDGLFVISAATGYGDLVGLRVVRVGETAVEEALELASATIAAGNDSRRRILLPDRMALPEVLAAVGIIPSASETELLFEDAAGEERRVTLAPLPDGPVSWSGGPRTTPLWLRDPRDPKWYEVLSDRSAIFVQVNELEAFPERPWADFVRETLEAARAAGVERYVLDLRHNAGGDGTWVTPFLTGLVGTEFDRYGRLMVLIGGHTFSAAQTLVNRLEKMTEACF